MNLLRHRPLAICCFVFLTALTLAAYTSSLAKLCLGAAAVLFLAVFLLLRRKKQLALLLPICVAISLLTLLYGYARFDRYFDMAASYGTEEVTLNARVTEVTYESPQAISMTATCEAVNGSATNERISIWAYTKERPQIGDRITLSATLIPVTGEDSLSLYLRARGIAAQAEEVFSLTIEESVPRPSDRLRGFFEELRGTLSKRLTDCVPGRGGTLLSALLLGEQELLEDTLVRDFRRTGISHVLSLSGLHLSLLIAALALLFHRLRWPRRALITAQILLVLFYMALTGFSVSITRAGLMTLLFCLSFFARREADGITSLAFAAALIALLSPHAVYDCGYWLSVTATLGILIRNEWKRGRLLSARAQTWYGRLLHAVIDSLGVTLAATFATLPLVALYFGEFSLIAPLCNLLLLPFFNLCLLLAVLALPLGGIPFVGTVFAFFAELPLSAVQAVATLPGIMISIDHTIVKIALALSAVAVLACLCAPRVGRKRTALLGAGSLLLVVLLVGGLQIYQATRTGVYYQYAGSNEMLLLQDGNRGILCDLSSGSYTAQKNGLYTAKQAYMTELDGYLLTHYHARHVESLPRLHGQILLRTLYLPTPQNETEDALYRQLTAAARELGIACVRYDAYEQLPFGRLTVQPHARGQSTSAHPAVAVSIRSDGDMLTYLGAGYHESDRKASAASAVEKSSKLIFGLHGGKEESLPSYPAFSAGLTTVILPYGARISPALADFLDTRLYVAEENECVWLPLS